jgi:hypothetical protein
MSHGAAIAFAVVLAFSAAASAMLARRSPAKFHIDLAAVVSAVLAVSAAAIPYAGMRLASDVAWIAIAVVPAALALASYARFVRMPASTTTVVALMAGSACGAGAVALHAGAPALLSLAAGSIAIISLGVLHLRREPRNAALMLGAGVALVAGASAFLRSGASSLLLFAAASLLGIALATASRLPVDKRGWPRRILKVRAKS